MAESLRLARERLRFDLTRDLGYSYPGAEDPTADRRLGELCRARLEDRYPASSPHRPEAERRLAEELALIRRLRLSGFFLLHHEMLELAREVALEVRDADSARRLLPPGRGRGSSVSSIVCYLTGLSHIDPVANDLFLGRFLNEELTDVPDIDLDFPRDIREKLIPRVHERHGARPLRPGRRLLHLPGAGLGARPRQGAGAAAGRGREAGSLGGRLREGGRRRAADRAGAGRAAGALAALAGAGASCCRRSLGCRATSRSIPAGW